MIAALTSRRTSGVALFVAFNVAVVVFVITFFFTPILSHFSDRSDDIAQNAAQLAHFENAIRRSKAVASGSGRDGVFLQAIEERIASADLQANIKTIATNAGVNLLGIRGLPGSKSQQVRMIAAGVELEGSLAAIRDTMRTIENQTPLLFVTAATLRSAADGDDSVVRAELTVQGAMRDGPSKSSDGEAGR